MTMRSAFDFAPFRRSTVGFDRLFDMLENSSMGGNGENYPPFDLIKLGIANRSFERRFALADHIQVRGADLKDGLLAVELVREIPEAMKPKKINIGSGSEQRSERSAIGG